MILMMVMMDSNSQRLGIVIKNLVDLTMDDSLGLINVKLVVYLGNSAGRGLIMLIDNLRFGILLNKFHLVQPIVNHE